MPTEESGKVSKEKAMREIPPCPQTKLRKVFSPGKNYDHTGCPSEGRSLRSLRMAREKLMLRENIYEQSYWLSMQPL